MNMDSNPFKAPDARVADAGATSGEFLPDGQVVPAGNGVSWITQGWEMFKQAPGVWIGVTLIFMVTMIVLGVIPLVNLAVALFAPVFVGGIMLGCKALEDGNELTINHLFAGFSNNFGNLVLVGAIYLVGIVAIYVLMFLIGGSALAGAALMGGGKASIAAILLPMLLLLLVMLALMIPLAMAVWYAPALVVFHEVAPLQAMKASFFICIKNFMPFLIYGLVVMVLAIVATIPIGLGWLVLMPVLCASVYTSYKDMFIRG